jgi:hypothetical protein
MGNQTADNNDNQFRVVESEVFFAYRLFDANMLDVTQFTNVFGSDLLKSTKREAFTA